MLDNRVIMMVFQVRQSIWPVTLGMCVRQSSRLGRWPST